MNIRNAALLILAVVILAALLAAQMIKGGFTARRPPNALEAAAAKTVRRMAIPDAAKARKNPLSASPSLLTEARRHYADHCASCHANDGSGDTALGTHLYPKAPDIRRAETQELSDGELYYVIQNGIAMSGMPAWGAGDADHDDDSWKLALFIRHLPQLTPAEIEDMKRFNAESPMERAEEKEEMDFLTGAASGASSGKAGHH
jgi:mono/diheme cytochrome c family protein